MHTAHPHVSVIVPCYNQASFLVETLRSVYSQSYSNWECIVVNDGSTDRSQELAENFASTDSRFQVVSQPNGGLSNARNVGIERSNGTYILPLDSDDIIEKDFISKTLSAMRNNSKTPNLTTVVSTGIRCFGALNYDYLPEPTNLNTLVGQNRIACTSLYPKSLWQSIKGYDETMKNGYEDWDFWIRSALDGAIFETVPDILFFYRKHKHSMLTESMSKRPDVVRYLLSKHSELFLSLHIDAILNREVEIANLNQAIIGYQNMCSKLETLNSELNQKLNDKVGPFPSTKSIFRRIRERFRPLKQLLGHKKS